MPTKKFDGIVTVCAMSVYKEDRLSWVQQAVESILNQSQPPTHYVIAIDGPIPETITQYLAAMQQQFDRISLLVNDENKGLAISLNRIVEYVLPLNPDYFFRMDADDIALPNRFELQLQFMQNHPKVDVLGGAVDEINEQGKVIGHRNLPRTHKRIWQFLTKRCPINHPTVVMRTRCFDKGMRYDEHHGTAEDYYLWIDLAKSGTRFANLSQTLLLYRRCDGFFVRRGAQKALCEFKARKYAMKSLQRYSLGNYIYAYGVLVLRFMPSGILKLAYKLDRNWLKFSLRKGG